MKKHIIALLLLIPLAALFGQSSGEKLEFIKIGVGAPTVSFRDFATSPLIYKGSGLMGDVSSFTQAPRSITSFGGHFTSGSSSDPYLRNSSSVTAGNLFYSKLYKLKSASKNIDWYFGGLIETTANFRMNSGLMNNALGIELAPSILASTLTTVDISRKSDKIFKPYSFLPGIRFPRLERSLSFQLNLGLLNGGYRNGYSYAGQSAVLNNFQIFEGYTYNPTAGARFSGELSFNRMLPNGNRIAYSYYFQQYVLNGFDRFEWMQHGLKISLLFLTKTTMK